MSGMEYLFKSCYMERLQMSQHFQLDDQLMFFLKAQCTTVVGGREIQGETQTHYSYGY